MDRTKKRIIDLNIALCAVLLLALPMLFIGILVEMTSSGPALYWSERIGCNNRQFKMPKFRSIRIDTPAEATHLLSNPEQWFTEKGVHEVLRGLTGWAQISRRDEIPIPQKCSLMLNIFTAMLLFDVKILWMTALKIINRDGVSH